MILNYFLSENSQLRPIDDLPVSRSCFLCNHLLSPRRCGVLEPIADLCNSMQFSTHVIKIASSRSFDCTVFGELRSNFQRMQQQLHGSNMLDIFRTKLQLIASFPTNVECDSIFKITDNLPFNHVMRCLQTNVSL